MRRRCQRGNHMSATIRCSNTNQQHQVKTENVMQPWSASVRSSSIHDVGQYRARGTPRTSLGPDAHIKAFCEQLSHNMRALCTARACGLVLLPLHPWEPPMYALSGTASSADVRFAYHAGTGWVGWIIDNKQLLFVPDCADEAALHRFDPAWTWYNRHDTSMASCHTESQYLGVPLLVDEKVIGVIGLLRHREDPAFMAADWHTLTGVAEQQATVIERQRQVQAKGIEMLELLAELHFLRMDGAPLTKMWDVVLTQGLPMLGFDAGHIRIKEGDELVLCALKDYPGKRPPRLRRLGQGISGWVAQHQRVLRTGRTRTWRMVGIPLLDDGQVVGTLVARKHKEDDFTETQLGWLLVITATLAAEMQSRRLKSIVERYTSAPQASTSSGSDVRVEVIAPREGDVILEHASGHLVG